MNEWRSGGVPDQRHWRGLRVRGEVKVVILIWSRLRGGNLVDIQTGSTVHWRLAFIAMGDYAGP